jgi:hypothetical protein
VQWTHFCVRSHSVFGFCLVKVVRSPIPIRRQSMATEVASYSGAIADLLRLDSLSSRRSSRRSGRDVRSENFKTENPKNALESNKRKLFIVLI